MLKFFARKKFYFNNSGNYSGCCPKIGSPKNPVTAEKTKNLVRKTEKLSSKFYNLS